MPMQLNVGQNPLDIIARSKFQDKITWSKSYELHIYIQRIAFT
jgi:hypothetical protein